MAPSVRSIVATIRLLPFSARPPDAFQVLPEPWLQSGPAVPARNLVKLSVVPELSDRCTVLIGVAGRATPGLSRLIAGSFQATIRPSKMRAIVSGCRRSEETPAT